MPHQLIAHPGKGEEMDKWEKVVTLHRLLERSRYGVPLNRIESIETTRRTFHHVPETELRKFFAEAYGIFNGPADKTAVIEFTGIAAQEVSTENWHPLQQGEWIDLATFRLAIPYGHHRELLMDILRRGENAK
ncbi:MAG: WYL domain-containing protein [Chitinispirillaceae bacterium]|nr:WYL domain-containing protein [Chitinispirillaceae bacterium]